MLSLFKILFLSITFALAANSDTNKVGNGGNIVLCPDRKILLDFYEHNVKFKSNKEASEIIQNKLSALNSAAPQLAEIYKNRAKTILSEVDFKDGVLLADSKDSKHLFSPQDKNCTVAQTATRRDRAISAEKKFIFREDIWKDLNEVNKAGLLMHEIIYEHLSNLGETDSIKARKINAYLFSEKIEKESFWKLVKDLRVPIYP